MKKLTETIERIVITHTKEEALDAFAKVKTEDGWTLKYAGPDEWDGKSYIIVAERTVEMTESAPIDVEALSQALANSLTSKGLKVVKVGT